MWLIRMSPTDDVSAQINMDMGLRSQISMDIQIISEFFPSVKYKIKILQYNIYIYNFFSSWVKCLKMEALKSIRLHK